MQKSRAEVVVRLRPPEREENVRETFDFPTDRPDVPLPPLPHLRFATNRFSGRYSAVHRRIKFLEEDFSRNGREFQFPHPEVTHSNFQHSFSSLFITERHLSGPYHNRGLLESCAFWTFRRPVCVRLYRL